MNEYAEMRILEDPAIDPFCQTYLFKVRIEKRRLLNKYVALWYIVKYLWKWCMVGGNMKNSIFTDAVIAMVALMSKK